MTLSLSKPLTRPSIAEYLAEEIFGGNYHPGDFVPRELDLCERFAINRSAVRSDLRQLVDAGIIERISGHGSKVREYSEWHILDAQVTDWLTRYAAPNPDIQREILAFRLDVEPYVAMTAAKRATARDLVAIEEAFEGLGQNLRPSIYLLVSMSNQSASDPEDSLERHRQLMESIRLRRPRDAFLAAQAVLAGTAEALGLEHSASSLGRSVELPHTAP